MAKTGTGDRIYRHHARPVGAPVIGWAGAQQRDAASASARDPPAMRAALLARQCRGIRVTANAARYAASLLNGRASPAVSRRRYRRLLSSSTTARAYGHEVGYDARRARSHHYRSAPGQAIAAPALRWLARKRRNRRPLRTIISPPRIPPAPAAQRRTSPQDLHGLPHGNETVDGSIRPGRMIRCGWQRARHAMQGGYLPFPDVCFRWPAVWVIRLRPPLVTAPPSTTPPTNLVQYRR